MKVQQWLETASEEEIADVITAFRKINKNAAKWTETTCMKKLLNDEVEVETYYQHLKNDHNRTELVQAEWFVITHTQTLIVMCAPLPVVEQFVREQLLTRPRHERLIIVTNVLRKIKADWQDPLPYDRLAVLTSLHDPKENLFDSHASAISQYLNGDLITKCARAYPQLLKQLSGYAVRSNEELLYIAFSLLSVDDVLAVLSNCEPLNELSLAKAAVKCSPRCLPYLNAKILALVFEEIGFDAAGKAAENCLGRLKIDDGQSKE